MEFDLSTTIAELESSQAQLAMESMLAPTANSATAWNAVAADLVNVQQPDPIAMFDLPGLSAALAPPTVGEKRSHAQMQPQSQSQALPVPTSQQAAAELSTQPTVRPDQDSSATTSLNQSHTTTPDTASHSHAHVHPETDPDKPSDTNPANCPTELTALPEIDPHAVCQMGGLPYAELCKERAREEFKEAKRNEHLANGDFDRTKRRKKNDTSMTPRQKYIRRLRMNQDSAAAARHAQEVYVHVLEKLVKTSEAEKKTFALEMQHIREQNNLLLNKVCELQTQVSELEEERNTPALDWDKSKDPLLASKFLDLIASAPAVNAQADFGVQPARAV